MAHAIGWQLPLSECDSSLTRVVLCCAVLTCHGVFGASATGSLRDISHFKLTVRATVQTANQTTAHAAAWCAGQDVQLQRRSDERRLPPLGNAGSARTPRACMHACGGELFV